MAEPAVADQQEPRARPPPADLRNRRRQHIDAVPAAKRPGEADDTVAAVEAQLALQLQLFGHGRRAVGVEIGAVRIHQNLVRIDPAIDQRILDDLRHHRDQRRLTERRLFRPDVQRLVGVALAFEAAEHRHFRAVVFDDVRDAQLVAELRATVVAQADTLVDVRRRQGLERGFQRRVVMGRPADDQRLGTLVAWWIRYDLTDAERVEQREAVAQERDEPLGAARQFFCHVTGVPIAAAGHNRRPEVGAQVDAGSAQGPAGRRRLGRRERHRLRLLNELLDLDSRLRGIGAIVISLEDPPGHLHERPQPPVAADAFAVDRLDSPLARPIEERTVAGPEQPGHQLEVDASRTALVHFEDGAGAPRPRHFGLDVGRFDKGRHVQIDFVPLRQSVEERRIDHSGSMQRVMDVEVAARGHRQSSTPSIQDACHSTAFMTVQS